MKNDKKHIHLVLTEKLNSLVVNFCEEFDISKTEFFKLLIIKYFSEDDVEKIWRKDIAFKMQVIWEERKFGTNINQIAHKLNIALDSDDLDYYDKEDVKTACADIADMKAVLYDLSELFNKRL